MIPPAASRRANRRVDIVSRACGEVLEDRRLLSRPTIVSAAFDYETSPHKYVVRFDQNVGASLTANELRVEAVTSTEQNPVPTSLGYDAQTNTATFTFAGVLPEANYRAVLASEDVANGAGVLLAADHVQDFFFLIADASGPNNVPDRLVGVADQNRISANFGGSNKTFSQGDYNYDTVVNMADFNILAGKFGSEMPAPPAGPGVPGTSQVMKLFKSASKFDLQMLFFGFDGDGLVGQATGTIAIRP
jgi:hypothetical protein